jgi:PleD family two-component response regulator
MNLKTPNISGSMDEPKEPNPGEPVLEKKRIFIVDDHAMFRDGLRRLIDLETDLVVCGDAPDAAAGLKGIRESEPDLVIVDISLDTTSGMTSSRPSSVTMKTCRCWSSPCIPNPSTATGRCGPERWVMS